MEPQNISKIPTDTLESQTNKTEPTKPLVEEPPVIVDWKKPLISMLVVGGIALGLMYIIKYM